MDQDLLQELYHLVSLAPTSMNCTPARFVFVTSDHAKRRLEPHLYEKNRPATMSAPVCAIIAQDLKFVERMDFLFPHAPDAARGVFTTEALIRETAFRNSSLQAGYLIMAARALGLDAGAMSGFDHAGLNAEFFPQGDVEANLLCNLGYAKEPPPYDRLPRLPFNQAAEIV